MARVDVKVVLLGQASVGKSALVERFINGLFDPAIRSTIGAAFAARRLSLPDGRGVVLGVWDTAGAERFEALSRVYYHSARAALVCFDATAPYSFEKLQFWVNELREHEPACKVYIVVTRCDLWWGLSGDRPSRPGDDSVASSFDVAPSREAGSAPSSVDQDAGAHFVPNKMRFGQSPAEGPSGEMDIIQEETEREEGTTPQPPPRPHVPPPRAPTPSLARAVPEEVVVQYAESVGAQVFETSSLLNRGVMELFQQVAVDLADTAPREDPNVIKLHEQPALTEGPSSSPGSGSAHPRARREQNISGGGSGGTRNSSCCS